MTVHMVYSIQAAVEMTLGLKPGAIRSKARHGDYVRARRVAMALTMEHCPHMTSSDVAHAFGFRDHTSVLHYRRKVREMIADDAELYARAEAMVRRIMATPVSASASTRTLRYPPLCDVGSVGK